MLGRIVVSSHYWRHPQLRLSLSLATSVGGWHYELMDLLELIYSRRTINNYKKETISDEVLHEAIKTGLFALNHRNTKPWRFIRLGGGAREKLLRQMVNIESQKGEVSPEKQIAMHAQIMNPSEIIALGLMKSDSGFQEREDYAALACAVQNMSLYLWSLGLGSKWGTGALTRTEETYQILDINPSEIELCGFFYMGYPLHVPPRPPKAQLEDCLWEK